MSATDGVVVSLYRYPVKSMDPEPLYTAERHWMWMHGDRHYAFVQAKSTSDFSRLTARDLSSLAGFGARCANSVDLRHSTVVVTDPEEGEFDIRDPRLTARLREDLFMPPSETVERHRQLTACGSYLM